MARIGGQRQVARMMASLRSPWVEQDVRRWIARSIWRGTPGFRLAVCLPDETLVGTVGVGGEHIPSCAFFLDPSHAGKGYATEAMRALLADAIPRFCLTVIEADHFADNPASGGVLSKLGFEKIGQGMGQGGARLEPAPIVHYRLMSHNLRV
jgi:RimJ/RimL family protein N-acetyltransferase